MKNHNSGGIAMKPKRRKPFFTIRKLIILIVVAAIAALFAPNGFFTGHRQVILPVETTQSTPLVHHEAKPDTPTTLIGGQVSSASGMPISGAMVTAFSADETYRKTVYSDADGHYQLAVSLAGSISVRVRTPYFSDMVSRLSLSGSEPRQLDFVSRKITDPEELSDSLTASAHLAMVQWSNTEDRTAFISQCNYCHQIGNSLTRRPRSQQEWNEVVDRMEGYLSVITNGQKKAIQTGLFEAFDGKPIEAIQTWDVSPKLAFASVEEWNAGDGLTFIHDADVGQDGRLYGVDEGHDVLWELNPQTREILEVPLPDVDLPVGGKFSGLALPLGVFTGKHGPHSMAETDDGRLWITNSLSSRLMAYTPKSNQFETYDIAADTLYLHTIRKGPKGRLWFTVVASNQVGVFDPKTEQLDLLDLPANGLARGITDAMLPTLAKIGSWFPRKNLPIILSHYKITGLGRNVFNFPYGIDINPKDGSAWYVKLYANRIGRIDPVTLEIEEFATPEIGPRRPRFAPDGMLWIPGFDTGELVKFDPQTRAFTHFKLPTLAPNEYETPYALNVHPVTGMVWITSNMSDRIFSFDPNREEFTSYPLPTRVSYLRDLVFTRDGKVCSSNSNLPSYAIEGGFGGFLCLDPGQPR
jgi:streptogramin lyase